MTIVQAVVLGLVQGITEFLPISSSAHLILVPWLLGWPDQGLGFDIVTNAGTLLAAVLYFRHDLLGSAMSARAELRRGLDRRPGLLLALAVATVPVVVVGLTFYDFFATGARSPLLIAITSIVFGLLLWWVDRIGTRQRNLEDLGWVDSVVIG
ncbi:MAG: undecaprenyl-diphosphate phosphatase, partial [Acidobacteriota bacterium]